MFTAGTTMAATAKYADIIYKVCFFHLSRKDNCYGASYGNCIESGITPMRRYNQAPYLSTADVRVLNACNSLIICVKKNSNKYHWMNEHLLLLNNIDKPEPYLH